MVKKQRSQGVFVWMPVGQVEHLKATARRLSHTECRKVMYTDLIRQSVADLFPVPETIISLTGFDELHLG